MHPILLVARRDYLAYVGAWGFWISLITAPLLLARAEPPRVIAILSERPEDAALVRGAFLGRARDDARAEIEAYLSATASGVRDEALVAFDAAGDRARCKRFRFRGRATSSSIRRRRISTR
jgi:ABC-2 type transport system permease protein